MDRPFEIVAGNKDDLTALGVEVLYHRGYDMHYIRNEGENTGVVTWHELTAIGAKLHPLSDKEETALEEQYQHAKD